MKYWVVIFSPEAHEVVKDKGVTGFTIGTDCAPPSCPGRQVSPPTPPGTRQMALDSHGSKTSWASTLATRTRGRFRRERGHLWAAPGIHGGETAETG